MKQLVCGVLILFLDLEFDCAPASVRLDQVHATYDEIDTASGGIKQVSAMAGQRGGTD